MQGSDPMKVFIVEDHPVVREGISVCINREADMRVCGEAEDCESAKSGIQKTQARFCANRFKIEG